MTNIKTHLSNGYLQLFSSNGRASRAEFWTLYTANLLILLVCILAAQVVPAGLTILLSIIGVLAVSFGNLASAVRRLHDTNRSGWWIASSVLPIMPFVVIFFLMQPSVSGPTRFDDDGGMPERTPDHFGRAAQQRLA